jgi:hypothetical protein
VGEETGDGGLVGLPWARRGDGQRIEERLVWSAMRLTRQERRVLLAVLLLLAVGWGVHRWRLGSAADRGGPGVSMRPAAGG